MRKDLLVVVDMQKDFITGALANPAAEAIVSKIVDRILNFEGRAIVVTKDTHQDNYLDTKEGKYLPVAHCIEDTDGWEIHPAIAAALEIAQFKKGIKIVYIHKPTFGYLGWKEKLAFNNIDMDKEVSKITYVGTCTGICVLSNLVIMKAAFPEKIHEVVESECACVTPESHKIAIEAMKLLQAEIV